MPRLEVVITAVLTLICVIAGLVCGYVGADRVIVTVFFALAIMMVVAGALAASGVFDPPSNERSS